MSFRRRSTSLAPTYVGSRYRYVSRRQNARKLSRNQSPDEAKRGEKSKTRKKIVAYCLYNTMFQTVSLIKSNCTYHMSHTLKCNAKAEQQPRLFVSTNLSHPPSTRNGQLFQRTDHVEQPTIPIKSLHVSMCFVYCGSSSSNRGRAPHHSDTTAVHLHVRICSRM